MSLPIGRDGVKRWRGRCQREGTGTAVLLGLAAAAATLVPSRRALRVDPAVTLKCE
jgi:hypothetical protein